MHVCEHDDVLVSFISLCRVAKLFGQFDIHLVYLSPEDDVMDLVGNLVTPPTETVPGTDDKIESKIPDHGESSGERSARIPLIAL